MGSNTLTNDLAYGVVRRLRSYNLAFQRVLSVRGKWGKAMLRQASSELHTQFLCNRCKGFIRFKGPMREKYNGFVYRSVQKAFETQCNVIYKLTKCASPLTES